MGSLIGSNTQTVHIPWRPEPDAVNCPGTTKWYNASDASCNNSFAFNVTFDLSASNITLPDALVLGIAFNTQTYGASPIGVSGPYNSLNVSLTGTATVGADGSTDRVFWNTQTASRYTDGGTAGFGVFREDTDWTPYGTIPFQITTAPAPCTTECYVDAASGDDANPGTAAYPMKTIQKGVDTVASTGIVHVEPGIYKGAVLIDKALTLKSTQGPAVTTIHGGDTASDTIYVVSIRASDVTLDGFTVTSPNYNAPGADLTGIMIGYYGDNDLANIVVKNNIVTQIGLSTRLVTQDDYPSVGMVVNGVIDGLQITNNKVFDIHQSVTDPAVTWGPTGIAYYGYDATPLSKNVVISGNEVYNISANAGAPATTIANGIRVGWGSGDGSITGNNIHDIAGRGIAVTSINNGTVAITGNVVTKTKTGIYMANALGGTILKNNLFNNGTGIQIDGAAPVSVHINRIFGNTITGLANTSSAAVAAENNWWGCNTGPIDVATKCDKTTNTGTGSITSTPWLILQTLANPASVDPSGTAAITANLRANSALADTSAAGYLVNGLPVAFTAPAGGVLAPTDALTLDAQATTTYTATAVRGNYEVCSTVDNQTTCMPLVVNNRAPMAVDDAYDTDQDTTLTITAPGVLANDSDPDGDTRTATLLTSVTHGTLTLKGDGSFIYTPAAGYFGTDTFTYQLVTYPALAATGWTADATVIITVHEVPVPLIYYYFPMIVK